MIVNLYELLLFLSFKLSIISFIFKAVKSLVIEILKADVSKDNILQVFLIQEGVGAVQFLNLTMDGLLLKYYSNKVKLLNYSNPIVFTIC